MEKIILGLVFVAGFLAVSFIVSLAMAFPVMLLWNWLMPVIFGLTSIGYWQAFGLMILSTLLFKSSVSSSK